MRFSGLAPSVLSLALTTTVTVPVTSVSSPHTPRTNTDTNIDANTAPGRAPPSPALFAELEELARIVDIAYCVGTTGIARPFLCASRCADFPAFELVDTFNTGPLLSDSCGYVVLDHGAERALVAFRGTYSLANTIVDLRTAPQEYVPYPGSAGAVECRNCTVHSGFWSSWRNTRELVLPLLVRLRTAYPEYGLSLVGHSLGGAVAALAGLELDAMGFAPVVTTFGEPRIGNAGLREFVDRVFGSGSGSARGEKAGGRHRYRRVTHVDDPVPLLPLREWGYRSHASELFIAKPELQPGRDDVRVCVGDEDVECSAGSEGEVGGEWADEDVARAVDAYNAELQSDARARAGNGKIRGAQNRLDVQGGASDTRWGISIPAQYKLWQLFFAHRDYFWRLGLCVPGGDPLDWGRDKYRFGDGGDEAEEGEGEGGLRAEL
ncbi:hypothetical protein BUE80_DR003216 [Diplocarpon rosae]|nr:hypothetical protein BUE80_DR003216 [Diplocarpon rosae]